MGIAVAPNGVDWWMIGYQIIIALCAIGGLILSVKNYYDRKSDSKTDLTLILEEWIDTTTLVKQKCIRCLISNTGKIPVIYENLILFTFINGKKIELYRFKWVSYSTEGYSHRTNQQDIIRPVEARMAVVRPQKLVRGLEENSINDRNVAIFVELKSAIGDIFQSNEINVNLSGIDSYNPDSNRIL